MEQTISSSEPTEIPSGTVTFLFTDIEGSTHLLEGLREGYTAVLADQRRLLRQAFAHWDGHEVDTQGDAIFVAFPRATQAVAAAVEAQHLLAEHPWPEGCAVYVRMGLHTGEPWQAEEGYVGMDVHRAARIAAVGHGRQILLSDAARGLVEGALPEGVYLRDLGKHRLKDLPRPENIYQLVVPGLPSEFPPLKSIGVLPNNLPLQLTSFIGRETEIEDVRRRLSSERLVTLVGAGGCGKTRLALQAASGLLEEYLQGVWWIELAPLSDPALVAQVVLKTLGLSDQGERSPQQVLVDFLRTKRLLLVLDNCEHIIEACAHLVDTLLRSCPELKVLVTSREALGIPGEAVFYVPSLVTPGAGEALSSEEAINYEAVRLFQERAAASLTGFQVTDDNAPAVAQVCRRLDSIPLAIELAAARVKILSVEQIAARLDDCFHLLTGGSRTALPRHQTLQAAIDWSYALLSEKERLLLQRLSVFSGGWTLEAAEAVCQGDGLAQAEILDLLEGLLSKSVVVAVQAPHGLRRFAMLETIRQYGRSRLRQADEEFPYLQQHLAYFLTIAEAGDLKLRGPESMEWMHRLDADYDNLRAAMDWSFGAGQNGEAGIGLAYHLTEFWNRSSYYYEWLDWLEIALDRSTSLKGTPLRAKTLLVYGCFTTTMLGKWEEGRPLLEECLQTWRALGRSYRNDCAYVLMWFGYFLFFYDQSQIGTAYLQEAVDILRETGDNYGLGWALNLFSDVKFDNGETDLAFAMAEEGVASFMECGDRYGVAICSLDLGSLYYSRGNLIEGQSYCEEALSIFREYGTKVFACQALRYLGEIARTRDEYEKAEAFYRESLSMCQEIGAGPRWFVSDNINLGYTVLYLGDDRQAVLCFKQALDLSKEANYIRELRRHLHMINCLNGFASVAAFHGKAKAAARLFGAADHQFRNLLSEGKTIESLIDPTDRRELERYQSLCRSQLGEAALEAAWVSGEGLSLEQALDEALAIS